MTDRHTEKFNRASIFGGQEPWRKEEGHKAGLKADLKLPPPMNTDRHTEIYIEGFLEGRDAKKRQMMEDLIMGKYDEDEVDDVKTQLGLPLI